MHSALANWLERLEQSALPALPASWETLSRLVKDDKASMPSLAAVIEKDPGLTLALLRRINALKKKHLRTEITTVEHGLMMLGLGHLRDLVASVPLLDKSTEAGRNRERLLELYSRADHAAWQAYDWARLRKDLEPDEVATATQLHGLAEMLLWLNAPEEMARIEAHLAGGEMPTQEAEYVELGFSIGELSLALVQRWGLPSLLLLSLQAENAANPRVLGILLALRLARVADKEWYHPDTTSAIRQVADYLHMDFGTTAARIHRNAVAVAHNTQCMQITPAAARLLHPSRPEAAPDWQTESETTADFCLIPQPLLVRHSLHELQNGARRPLPELLATTLEAMHDGVGLNRVVFAILNKDRSGLKARSLLGADDDPQFSSFAIDLDAGDGLFTQLMRKPQAVWLNETNRERFLPLIPEPFRKLSRAESFFAMSVFVGSKPVGLFYADRHSSACTLDGKAYHQFKQLALAAAKAMETTVGKGPT